MFLLRFCHVPQWLFIVSLEVLLWSTEMAFELRNVYSVRHFQTNEMIQIFYDVLNFLKVRYCATIISYFRLRPCATLAKNSHFYVLVIYLMTLGILLPSSRWLGFEVKNYALLFFRNHNIFMRCDASRRTDEGWI